MGFIECCINFFVKLLIEFLVLLNEFIFWKILFFILYWNIVLFVGFFRFMLEIFGYISFIKFMFI